MQFLDHRLPERFWSKVSPEPNSGCWLWTRRMAKAHRHAYVALVGSVPNGLDLDHVCRVRCCVNPAHLEPVTRRENIVRGNGVIAKHAAATHCLNGHPFDRANTIVVRTKSSIGVGRDCRACRRARKAAARAQHKKAS